MTDLVQRLRSRCEGYYFGPALDDLAPMMKDAADEIERLHRLRTFAKDLLRIHRCTSIDGADVEALALSHGLLVRAEYDPDVHGDIEDTNPGDEIYTLSEWMK